ncbi:MAG TPA: hypothetical protein VF688_05070 [Allosphingosinicella sp.]|jgi:hypothetical protein
MTDRASPKPSRARKTRKKSEAEVHLDSLREHDRVIESADPEGDLPPGVTHVLLPGGDGEEPRLVERRKSFF